MRRVRTVGGLRPLRDFWYRARVILPCDDECGLPRGLAYVSAHVKLRSRVSALAIVPVLSRLYFYPLL